MPHLQLNDTQFPLFVGETHVGRGVGADVPLPGSESEQTSLIAVVTIGDDHVATISSATDEYQVTVNGVALGTEASPLQHGDRISIGDVDMRFADELQAMVTLPVPAALPGRIASRRSSEPALTGGRLVSLIDGREYLVGPGSITIGRDAGCDVVVGVTEVSRRHARIESTPEGYVVTDTSTNGVLLNGERIAGRASLGRGDTLRIGPEEFRFHADVPPPSATSVIPPAAEPESATPEVPAPAAISDSGPTAGAAIAEVVPRAQRPVLATLEQLNEGPGKGTRLDITTPLSHVGRGAHNDVIVPDDSVSDLHAKIQLRENGWFVVDMGSTNGTYVGGERVKGEAPLVGNVDVRFGGMKYAFRDVGSGKDVPRGTRVIVGLNAPAPLRAPDAARPRSQAMPAPGPERLGVPRPLLFVLILLAVAIVYFFLKGA